MAKRKYTLPRHTILAKNSSRTGAFLIDLAISLAISLVLVFGCFNFIFKSTTEKFDNQITQEKLNSGLFIENESGEVTGRSFTGEFNEINDVISYYFLNYLTGENIKDGLEACKDASEPIVIDGVSYAKKDFYNVKWYNENVLQIGENPESATDKGLFTYQKDGESFNKEVIGIPKESSSKEDINSFMQKMYVASIGDSFNLIPYVYDWNSKLSFYYTLEFVLGSLIGISVTYIVFPLIFKNGQTVGKKVFKLGLATSDGYKMQNKQLIMRAMPVYVVILAMLIPIWTEIVFIFIMFLVMFLVSFALSMSSPKRKSLHDFTGGTIVVDLAGSILFNNELEEEEYILKEDNLFEEKEIVAGEEPDLKYEK